MVSGQVVYKTYAFVIATGFLCGPADTGACPAVARSVDGDSYEIGGAGTFDVQSKSAKAAGTFVHKSTNGNVVGTGVWTATSLISFDSYGTQPAALMQRGMATGSPQVGYRRKLPGSAALPTGGLAIFQIVLIPVSGIAETAVLQVNCALANVPRERSVEGIRIKLDKNNSEYSEEAGARVVFLAQKLGANEPSKVEERGDQSEEQQK